MRESFHATTIVSVRRGDQVVVGVNRFLESEASPLSTGAEAILTVSEEAERGQIEQLRTWREARDNNAVQAALGRDWRTVTDAGLPRPLPELVEAYRVHYAKLEHVI